MLAVSGKCQEALGAGDWSDGSGECCCTPGSQAPTVDATAISLPSSQGSSQTMCHPEKKVCLCRLPPATSSLPYKLSTRPTPTTTTSLPQRLSTPTSISSTPHRLSTPLPS